MKRSSLLCLLSLTLAGPLLAQSNTKEFDPAPVERKPRPSADQHHRDGLVSSLAEAQPLLKKMADDQEAHFQARRAAFQQMAGKTDEEKQKIWVQMIAAEKERRGRMRDTARIVSEVEKQEREKKHKSGKSGGS